MTVKMAIFTGDIYHILKNLRKDCPILLQVNFSQTEIQMRFDFQASGFDLPDSIFYDALMMMTEFSHACHIFMHVLCDNCRRGG